MSNNNNFNNLVGSLGDINIDVQKLLNSTMPVLPTHNIKNIEFDNSHIVNHREEEKMYWEQSLGLLKSIEVNTANLGTLVDLISTSNEKQDEIIKIITELLELAKETDKNKAVSKYKQIMGRIGDIANNADALVKLYGFGQLIGIILKTKGIL